MFQVTCVSGSIFKRLWSMWFETYVWGSETVFSNVYSFLNNMRSWDAHCLKHAVDISVDQWLHWKSNFHWRVFLVLYSSKYPKLCEAPFIISILWKHIFEIAHTYSIGTQKVNGGEYRKLSGWRKFLRVADLKSLITLIYWEEGSCVIWLYCSKYLCGRK